MHTQPGLQGPGAPTHLLHTMTMTTTAMRKIRPAAEEPMMSGSFSWMLVWYSAGEKAQRSPQLLPEVLTSPTLQGLLGAPGSIPAPGRGPVTCSGGEQAVTHSQVTLDKSMNCSNPQFLIYKWA